MSLQTIYEDRVLLYKNLYAKKQNSLLKISVARLVIFAFIILPFVFIENLWLKYALSFVALLVFLLLIRLHQNYTWEKRFLAKMIKINTQELAFLNENATFSAGEHFISPVHFFSSDLDIFGKQSLFGFISRAKSFWGEKEFAFWLTELPSEETIKKRQLAAQELTAKIDFRQQFLAYTTDLSQSVCQKILALKILDTNLPFSQNFIPLIKYLPFLHLPILAYSIYSDEWRFFWLFGGFLLIISTIFAKKITQFHQEINLLGNHFEQLAALLMMVENNHFEAEMLKEIKNKSTQDKQLSSKVFFDLSKLLRLFDYRLNPFAWLVLNGFFLWDLNKSIEIKNWLRTYSWQIDEKIDLIAKIEAIISVATFAYNHPNYILPKLDSKHIIQAKNLAHPLIRTRGRVGNDFEIADNGKICLLTGANMAGKSTFMRTVGINLVLAWTGAPVCAEAFSFKPIWIYSGMRSVDSLSESTSSFFAELKRLSNLVKEAQNGKSVFALLDEILKGTNSKDRNLGSKGLIEKLIKLQTSAIITTHDLELADIKTAFPENVDLKCFEIETRNDELVFDFKLRDGVCRHQNATFLMKKMAII